MTDRPSGFRGAAPRAYSTPTRFQTAVENLAEKAAGYGIPGHIVDGNDVVACYEVMRGAAEFARSGGGAPKCEAEKFVNFDILRSAASADA